MKNLESPQAITFTEDRCGVISSKKNVLIIIPDIYQMFICSEPKREKDCKSIYRVRIFQQRN